MVNGIRVKVCGLTSLVDAEAADAAGADYLGFIFYPKSPRAITLEQYRAMAPRLPPRKKVAVVVEPSDDELNALKAEGFDHVQLHFPNETPFFMAAMWLDIIPPDKLWLAPRIPPGRDLDLAFVPLADTLLLDAPSATDFGGTGKTGDWATFSALRKKFIKVNWVLAGGLNPDNIAAAVTASGARYVDVNSGVEASPGVKDHAKLKAFVAALQGVTPPP
ncbi:MAG: phosphoribosylanthranilate isomerase [Verrucomicrobia bacterium]|nr:phosphoribosylanthranilate isomerase [Verrucomicrobiota bacterium]